MSRNSRTDCQGFYRRDFLTIGSAGFLGLTLPDILRMEASASPATRPQPTVEAKARNVIMIWLGGGPSTIDMWDLKPDAPNNIRGEFRPIDTRAPGVQICQHLPRIAAVMDRCAVVRSLAHGIADHGAAAVYMIAGNRSSQTLRYPSLGSLASRIMPPAPGVPPYIKFGGGGEFAAGYLGTTYNPFQVQDNFAANRPVNPNSRTAPQGNRVPGVSLPPGFTLEQLQDRDSLRNVFDESFRSLDSSDDVVSGMDRFQQQALEILRANRTQQALDINTEPAAVRERYGNDPFGRAGLASRRLIEAGARFVTFTSGGWDTHGQNFSALRQRLLPPVDRTVSALIEDLDRRGLLRTTIVYLAGEFNRTPRINNGAGRDHWGRSMAVFLAGGGIKPGYAHGATDANGMAPNRAPCTPDDVSATIFHCLGFEPNYELISPLGRPLHIFPNGRVIQPLLA